MLRNALKHVCGFGPTLRVLCAPWLLLFARIWFGQVVFVHQIMTMAAIPHGGLSSSGFGPAGDRSSLTNHSRRDEFERLTARLRPGDHGTGSGRQGYDCQRVPGARWSDDDGRSAGQGHQDRCANLCPIVCERVSAAGVDSGRDYTGCAATVVAPRSSPTPTHIPEERNASGAGRASD
jgi:hypothetical protein